MGVKQTKFKVVIAFENYCVGQIIEPTGLWRGELLARRFIAPVIEPEPEVKPTRRKRLTSHAD